MADASKTARGAADVAGPEDEKRPRDAVGEATTTRTVDAVGTDIAGEAALSGTASTKHVES